MRDPVGFLDPEYRPIVDRFTAFSPTNIEGLAAKLGVTIFKHQDDSDPELQYVFDKGSSAIFLRSTNTVSRQRYFAAKGLAAFMLRNRLPVSDLTLSDIALEIIMPSRLIGEYCRLNNCAPQYHPRIADHFKVTVEALRHRLKSLGYSWPLEEEQEVA